MRISDQARLAQALRQAVKNDQVLTSNEVVDQIAPLLEEMHVPREAAAGLVTGIVKSFGDGSRVDPEAVKVLGALSAGFELGTPGAKLEAVPAALERYASAPSDASATALFEAIRGSEAFLASADLSTVRGLHQAEARPELMTAIEHLGAAVAAHASTFEDLLTQYRDRGGLPHPHGVAKPDQIAVSTGVIKGTLHRLKDQLGQVSYDLATRGND